MIAQVIYLSDGIDENSIWGRRGIAARKTLSIQSASIAWGDQRLLICLLFSLHKLLFCKWPRCAQYVIISSEHISFSPVYCWKEEVQNTYIKPIRIFMTTLFLRT